jgi:hypothetical protein
MNCDNVHIAGGRAGRGLRAAISVSYHAVYREGAGPRAQEAVP